MSVLLQTTTPAVSAVAGVSGNTRSDRRVSRRRRNTCYLLVSIQDHLSGYYLSSLSLSRWCFRGGFRWLLLAIAAIKAVNASRRVNQFLLAGKERMARRANLHVQVVFSRRAGLESVPTGAGNGDLVIFRVNSWFHFFWPSCPYRCQSTLLLQRVMIRGQSSEVKFASMR